MNISGDAKIKGYSIAWQQNFGAGFGVIANYTYSDAENRDTGDGTHRVTTFF